MVRPLIDGCHGSRSGGWRPVSILLPVGFRSDFEVEAPDRCPGPEGAPSADGKDIGNGESGPISREPPVGHPPGPDGSGLVPAWRAGGEGEPFRLHPRVCEWNRWPAGSEPTSTSTNRPGTTWMVISAGTEIVRIDPDVRGDADDARAHPGRRNGGWRFDGATRPPVDRNRRPSSPIRRGSDQWSHACGTTGGSSGNRPWECDHVHPHFGRMRRPGGSGGSLRFDTGER